MNQTATKQLSFRQRRAEFSMRIQANGRMGIMPKEAITLELEKTTLKESLGQLYRSRAALHAERNKHPQRSPEWLRIDETLNRVRGQIGNTEKLLSEAKEKHWAVLFAFCAEQLLTHQAYAEIRSAVWEMFGKAPTIPDSQCKLIAPESTNPCLTS